MTDPLMIASAIADVLGLGEGQGRSATDDLLGWMAGRETLLVLDNCEHLLDGVVVLLERLLAGSPRLVVLATSRARLLVPVEWAFPVPGLSGLRPVSQVAIDDVWSALRFRPLKPGEEFAPGKSRA